MPGRRAVDDRPADDGHDVVNVTRGVGHHHGSIGRQVGTPAADDEVHQPAGFGQVGHDFERQQFTGSSFRDQRQGVGIKALTDTDLTDRLEQQSLPVLRHLAAHCQSDPAGAGGRDFSTGCVNVGHHVQQGSCERFLIRRGCAVPVIPDGVRQRLDRCDLPDTDRQGRG